MNLSIASLFISSEWKDVSHEHPSEPSSKIFVWTKNPIFRVFIWEEDGEAVIQFCRFRNGMTQGERGGIMLVELNGFGKVSYSQFVYEKQTAEYLNEIWSSIWDGQVPELSLK